MITLRPASLQPALRFGIELHDGGPEGLRIKSGIPQKNSAPPSAEEKAAMLQLTAAALTGSWGAAQKDRAASGAINLAKHAVSQLKSNGFIAFA